MLISLRSLEIIRGNASVTKRDIERDTRNLRLQVIQRTVLGAHTQLSLSAHVLNTWTNTASQQAGTSTRQLSTALHHFVERFEPETPVTRGGPRRQMSPAKCAAKMLGPLTGSATRQRSCRRRGRCHQKAAAAQRQEAAGGEAAKEAAKEAEEEADSAGAA